MKAIGCLLEPVEEKETSGSGLTPEICQRLLLHSTPEDTKLEEVAETLDPPTPSAPVLVGYPSSPLYQRLSDCMACWLVSG